MVNVASSHEKTEGVINIYAIELPQAAALTGFFPHDKFPERSGIPEKKPGILFYSAKGSGMDSKIFPLKLKTWIQPVYWTLLLISVLIFYFYLGWLSATG